MVYGDKIGTSVTAKNIPRTVSSLFFAKALIRSTQQTSEISNK